MPHRRFGRFPISILFGNSDIRGCFKFKYKRVDFQGTQSIRLSLVYPFSCPPFLAVSSPPSSGAWASRTPVDKTSDASASGDIAPRRAQRKSRELLAADGKTKRRKMGPRCFPKLCGSLMFIGFMVVYVFMFFVCLSLCDIFTSVSFCSCLHLLSSAHNSTVMRLVQLEKLCFAMLTM